MEHDNTNRGAIWKNAKKVKDTQPDFTGSLNVNGAEYWVSAWKRKESASAQAPALSFEIKPKEDREGITGETVTKLVNQGQPSISERATAKIKKPYDDMDGDEIPF